MGALHLYYVSYLFGICTSAVIYIALNMAFPHRQSVVSDDELSEKGQHMQQI